MDVARDAGPLFDHRRVAKPLERRAMLQAVFDLSRHEGAQREVVDGQARLVENEQSAADAIRVKSERQDRAGAKARAKLFAHRCATPALKPRRRDVHDPWNRGLHAGTEEVRVPDQRRHDGFPHRHVFGALLHCVVGPLHRGHRRRLGRTPNEQDAGRLHRLGHVAEQVQVEFVFVRRRGRAPRAQRDDGPARLLLVLTHVAEDDGQHGSLRESDEDGVQGEARVLEHRHFHEGDAGEADDDDQRGAQDAVPLPAERGGQQRKQEEPEERARRAVGDAHYDQGACQVEHVRGHRPPARESVGRPGVNRREEGVASVRKHRPVRESCVFGGFRRIERERQNGDARKEQPRRRDQTLAASQLIGDVVDDRHGTRAGSAALCHTTDERIIHRGSASQLDQSSFRTLGAARAHDANSCACVGTVSCSGAHAGCASPRVAGAPARQWPSRRAGDLR